MSMGLLKTRRFGPFFVTQFLGAFNDNVFKNALIILLAFQAAGAAGMDANTLVNLSAGLFILPFFLFSATAGTLADRVEKAALIRRIKLFEIAIMVFGALAFMLSSVTALMAVLFMMGTQSAFFGPAKYAILPQHLAEYELVSGNGLVEMGTFLAILLGTVLGGVLIADASNGRLYVGLTVITVAIAGWFASRHIPAAPPPVAAPSGASGSSTPKRGLLALLGVDVVRQAATDRTIFNSILGISWFWFYGAICLAQLPNLARTHLGGDETVTTLLLTVFSLGIGIGSVLCERMSGRLVEIGLVPFGAIGLTVFALDLYLAVPEATLAEVHGMGVFMSDATNWRVLFDLFAMALFGGFYIVPLYALVQVRSPPASRSRIIAANNILNALFMVVSAGAAIALLSAGVSIPQLFLVVALMTAAVAIYIFMLVPEFLMRFIVWMLIHTIYRLRSINMDAIPDKGPVLLTCNHVSFVDALIIAAACRRPIRFVMDHKIFKMPIVSFVFRVGRAIPIAPARDDPDMMERAFDTVAESLAAGEVVAIFPEGKITSDGAINPFRPGVQRIVERSPVSVVPMALRGLWGSFFSRKYGRAMSRPTLLLRRFREPVELVAAAPVPASAFDTAALETQVRELRGEWA